MIMFLKLLYGACDKIKFYVNDDQDLDLDIRQEYDHDYKKNVFNLIGSCNGLVCFRWSPRAYSADCRYVVCNPCLHEYVETEELHELVYKTLHVRLVYVSSLDDYQIVSLGVLEGARYPEMLVNVYSLRSKQWTTSHMCNDVGLDFHSLNGFSIGALVRETLHWGIGKKARKKCIGAFDLANQEVFEFMPLPNTKLGDDLRNMKVIIFSVLGCAVWTKLFFVNTLDLRTDEDEDFVREILGLTESGKVLVHTCEADMVLSEMRYDQPAYVRLICVHISGAVNYCHILISPLTVAQKQEN